MAQQAEATGASVRDIVRDLFDALAPRPATPPAPSAPVTPTPAPPPTSKKPGAASGEEVRMVLKLLESGAITVEEAERLIEALS